MSHTETSPDVAITLTADQVLFLLMLLQQGAQRHACDIIDRLKNSILGKE